MIYFCSRSLQPVWPSPTRTGNLNTSFLWVFKPCPLCQPVSPDMEGWRRNPTIQAKATSQNLPRIASPVPKFPTWPEVTSRPLLILPLLHSPCGQLRHSKSIISLSQHCFQSLHPTHIPLPSWITFPPLQVGAVKKKNHLFHILKNLKIIKI